MISAPGAATRLRLRPAAGRALRLVRSPLRLLLRLLALQRSRQRLAELDARMLRDIGVTPQAARREADRPPWDVPRHWLR